VCGGEAAHTRPENRHGVRHEGILHPISQASSRRTLRRDVANAPAGSLTPASKRGEYCPGFIPGRSASPPARRRSGCYTSPNKESFA
jgi:hypothetical protein